MQIGGCEWLVGRQMGRNHLMGKGFYFGVMEMLWNEIKGMVIPYCEGTALIPNGWLYVTEIATQQIIIFKNILNNKIDFNST